MSLDEENNDDLIDELESRGYIVIGADDYNEVLDQIKHWKQ